MTKADDSWKMKFGSFGDWLRFFRPPHVIVPDDEDSE